ncbi:MAG: GNAT family N-acetyltransferase [Rhodospirillales bacterium]|nr:GNAT family N-acetyltransferase [Rhodospirillales bacterium]
MNGRIVPAGVNFAGVISALHGACFEQCWSEKSVRDILAMPGATGLIIRSDKDTPVGFMLFRQAADEAEIISIGVVPSSRRTGYAGHLLNAAIQHALYGNAARMFLEVAEDNSAAIPFYEKAGFTISGRRPAYYHRTTGKTDALIYVLEIIDK